MMLASCLKEILDRYEIEKTKRFKDNSLVLKIRKDLPKEFSKFIGDDFTVKAACGVSSWPEAPWITIISDIFDSSQEALIIQYNFDVINSSLSLSIISRLKDTKQYTSLRRFLSKFIDATQINGFQVNENANSNELLVKYYTYDQLNDVALKSDLDYIIPIYEDLSNHFMEFIGDDVMSNKQTTPKKTQIRVKDITVSHINENVYQNNLKNPEELFTDENIEKIIRCDIHTDDYKFILDTIRQSGQWTLTNLVRDYDLNINELSVKDRVLLFAKSFTDVEYKSVGRILGSYSFSQIRIDDRLSRPLIITSIIHELTHFLLEKIIKEVLMKVLNTNDTPLISSFVKILLEDDLNYLLDEYCAHNVEGRFTLYGYQDYSSFNCKLNEISHLYSKEDIDYALLMANTFAYDIKDIMEDFIDDDLREDIKDEFLKLPDKPNYEPLELEIDSKLEGNYFIEALALILTSGIGEVLNNPQKLERYMDKYDEISKLVNYARKN